MEIEKNKKTAKKIEEESKSNVKLNDGGIPFLRLGGKYRAYLDHEEGKKISLKLPDPSTEIPGLSKILFTRLTLKRPLTTSTSKKVIL